MNDIINQNKQRLLGKVFKTNKCGDCFVVDYKSSRDVTVFFHDPPYVTKCTVSSLYKGKVKNLLKPQVYGVGYIGVGSYKSRGEHREVYLLWTGMLNRVYCEKQLENTISAYRDVTVCDEWLNFQNFAAWCYNEPFFKFKDDKGTTYSLDKDLLVKGNKVYSPDTCCFIPQDVNCLIINGKGRRGKCPVGVHYSVRDNKFYATMKKNGEVTYLGIYTSSEEAFNVYKKAKEVHIKNVAEKWKGKVANKVYEALIKYGVDIND